MAEGSEELNLLAPDEEGSRALCQSKESQEPTLSDSAGEGRMHA